MVDTYDSGTAAAGKGRPGFPVEPLRVRQTLWRRRVPLVVIPLLFAVAALVFVKVVMGNVWETEVLLQYEGDIAVGDIQPGSRWQLVPAAEALHRRSVLEKIREVIGFPGSAKDLGKTIESEIDLQAATLRIIVGGDTASDAAKRARQVTDIFLQHHADRQARRIEQELHRLQTRLNGASSEAEEARERYAAFLELHGIQHSQVEKPAGTTGDDFAVDLLTQSELTASEVRALQATVEVLRAQLDSMPKTTAAVGVNSDRRAYDSVRQELAVAKATLSPEHPKVRALQQQVAGLSRQPRGTSSSGEVVANAAYLKLSEELRAAEWKLASLQERRKGLETVAADAKQRAKAMTGVEGEAAALLAAVQANEALIGRLQATEAALEDGLEHPPSGFVVLDPGAVPEYPVANQLKKVVFVLVALLGIFLGLYVALRREFKGFPLKAPSEIAFWGGGPVLASTVSSADPEGLDEIIASLDDYAPDARGKFLLLGGGPNESRLAIELAHGLRNDWFHDVSAGQSAGFGPGPTYVSQSPAAGPYPVGGSSRPSAAPSSATALAVRPSVKLVGREPSLFVEAWDGPPQGQALRRAARLADRVIVLIASGSVNPKEMLAAKRRLGRESGIGFIVLGVPEELESLADRVGDVSQFWAV